MESDHLEKGRGKDKKKRKSRGQGSAQDYATASRSNRAQEVKDLTAKHNLKPGQMLGRNWEIQSINTDGITVRDIHEGLPGPKSIKNLSMEQVRSALKPDAKPQRGAATQAFIDGSGKYAKDASSVPAGAKILGKPDEGPGVIYQVQKSQDLMLRKALNMYGLNHPLTRELIAKGRGKDKQKRKQRGMGLTSAVPGASAEHTAHINNRSMDRFKSPDWKAANSKEQNYKVLHHIAASWTGSRSQAKNDEYHVKRQQEHHDRMYSHAKENNIPPEHVEQIKKLHQKSSEHSTKEYYREKKAKKQEGISKAEIENSLFAKLQKATVL